MCAVRTDISFRRLLLTLWSVSRRAEAYIATLHTCHKEDRQDDYIEPATVRRKPPNLQQEDDDGGKEWSPRLSARFRGKNLRQDTPTPTRTTSNIVQFICSEH
mgnify:CR=1 FL=1